MTIIAQMIMFINKSFKKILNAIIAKENPRVAVMSTANKGVFNPSSVLLHAKQIGKEKSDAWNKCNQEQCDYQCQKKWPY